MTIGERILMYRAKNNLTQQEMANLINENVNTIFNYENSKHKPHKKNELRVLMKLDELERDE